MGYRSELYVKMKKEFKPKFIFYLKINEIDYFEDKSDTNDNTYIQYYACDLKWYNGYSTVDKFNSFLQDNSDSITMLRIGEEGGDVEEYGGNCYDFDLTYYVDVTIEGF